MKLCNSTYWFVRSQGHKVYRTVLQNKVETCIFKIHSRTKTMSVQIIINWKFSSEVE